MAYCPHCKKELNQDNLENTMNNFEPGIHSQDILSSCEHCYNSIKILHRKWMYFIESIQEDEENQCIGAK
jgi:Fe-S oxidoreductase